MRQPRLDVAADTQFSPYGPVGDILQLDRTAFVEDYVLARDTANKLEVGQFDAAGWCDEITAAITEKLPDSPEAHVLAVSAMVSEAKRRSLRRPAEENRKAIRAELRTFLSLSSFSRYRDLRWEELNLVEQQEVCVEAVGILQDEAIALLGPDYLPR